MRTLLLLLPAFIFAQKKDITLDDIWTNNTFAVKHVRGIRSMKDGNHYTVMKSSEQGRETFIIKYAYTTGNATDTLARSGTLIPSGSNTSIEVDEYLLSDDETKILISSESEPIYRHSTREDYYVWEIKTKKLNKVTTGEKQMYGNFSPDGNKVAFVRDNNIFIKDLAANTETAVTTDGAINKIINGNPDWVYQEEFEFTQAYAWSPDGKKLAYYKFDESRVKEYSFDEYGTLYPTQVKYKYPKAGEDNSIVTIHIYDVENKKTIAADIGPETNQYIPRIKWTANASTLSIQRMNRQQNKLELLLCEASTGKTSVILTEESNTFIDVNNDLYFLEDKQHFTWTSSRDGYKNLYLYTIAGKLEQQVTKGKADITQFYGYNDRTRTFFYQSAEPTPMERQVHSVTLQGENKLLSRPGGTTSAEFSATYNYFISKFSDVEIPFVYTLCNASGKEVRVLEDNKQLKEKLTGYRLSKKEFFKVKNRDGIEMNGWMIRPPDFDATKKYPVMMYVYGGPGVIAQTVTNTWASKDFFWHQLLAQKGIIVVSVDNRGTSNNGAAYHQAIFKQMGRLETMDQIDVAKYLGSQSYVDPKRIAIQGWSYGGYMSSLLMTKGADYFKAGIAVAPVTNWRYYDNIYTERYLRTPQENTAGYDDNSPINFVKDLKGKFLLVHGMSDDNVHFQNSVEMIDALTKANKQFDLAIYPGKNHSILGGNTRLHLYTKMTEFLMQNL